MFRQHFPPIPARFVPFGHQVPFVLLPINGITAITSAGQHGPLGTALGAEAGAAAKQFCLEGKGKKKEREKPNSYKWMGPWVLRNWAKEEGGSRPHGDMSRRRVDRTWMAPTPNA